MADLTDLLVIAGERFSSRLIMGTGGAPSLDILERALDASGTQIVTVALRRLDPSGASSFLDVVAQGGRRILPNTAGCYTAHDAVTTAQLAREAFETQLDQARGDRRRGDAAARWRRAPGRRGAADR